MEVIECRACGDVETTEGKVGWDRKRVDYAFRLEHTKLEVCLSHLRQQTFLMVLEAGKHKIKVLADLVLGEVHFQAYKWPPCLFVST